MGPPRPTKRRRMSESGLHPVMAPLSPVEPLGKPGTQFTAPPLTPLPSLSRRRTAASDEGDGDDSNGDINSDHNDYSDDGRDVGAVIPSRLLDRATRVLQIEARAVAHVAHIYSTDPIARDGLTDAVQAVLTTQACGGKVVVCGVGKSAYIAQKAVATFKSLGISASFMHGCEAVHGDLGDVRAGRDVLLFVSFSGRTPELLNLLPHIARDVRVLAMTSHRTTHTCPLLADRPRSVLLPTPVLEDEVVSFGVSAPTTSTTVTLAVCDMLALVVADELHGDRTKQVFGLNHPGGAIGVSYRQVQEMKTLDEDVVSVVELPSPSVSAESED